MEIRTAEELVARAAELAAHAGRRPGRRPTARYLVEPVLRGLRWNLDSMAETKLDLPSGEQGETVDYALYVGSRPAVAVVVTGYGEPLCEDAVAAPGFEWTLATNGSEWTVTSAIRPEAPFMTVDVTGEGRLGELAILSKESVESGKSSELAEGLVTDAAVADALVDLLRDKTYLRAELHKRLPNVPLRRIQASVRRLEVSVNGVALERAKGRPQPSAATADRDAIKEFLEASNGLVLSRVAGAKSTFSSGDGRYAAQVLASRVHGPKGRWDAYYWYSMRPLIFDLAETHETAVICLGRADSDEFYMIPAGRMRAALGLLTTSTREDEVSHYHAFIHIDEEGSATMYRNDNGSEPVLALDGFVKRRGEG